MKDDIIAALASSPGEGAIGIIEVFGTGAVEAVDRVFQSPGGRILAESCPGDLLYGRIVDDGRVVDEVLVRIASRNPDRLDINCHGGPVPYTAIMGLLEELGVGRRTWRELASAAGRSQGLDAIQIEAAERIPSALTLTASMMLVAQYNGALSELVGSGDLVSRREELLELAAYGIALCDPPKTVIAGRPNVGKSTLTNALLGRERVIASPVPGTTRDAVASFLSVDGVPLELVDTAGMGGARGELEILAAEKARSILEEADLVLCVLDGSEGITREDEDLISACAGKKTVIVINKEDLPRHSTAAAAAPGAPCVSVSAAEKTGIEDLRKVMLEVLFGKPVGGASCPEAVPFTRRQAALLEELNEGNAEEIRKGLLGN